MQKPAFPVWPQLDAADYDSVKSVLDAKALWCGAPLSPCGQHVWRFQQEFAQFAGARHCLAVTNGTHALEVALLGLGIGLGDEVIVTDYTFVASASAVIAVNAVPVFCDIDPRTLNLDARLLRSLITPRTKAILAVHLGGMPCDLDAILEVARQNRLRVIEDCAHAHGSKYRGRRLGNWGDCGTFSFQASKILAAGEGGAIICNDDELADRLYSVADCGRKKGHYFYAHYQYGSNYRLGEFQAALLRSQLAKFRDGQHERRNRNADYLRSRLDAVQGLCCQQKIDGVEEVGQYVFPVTFDPREFKGNSKADFYRKLKAHGIPTADCYPPLHSLACFKEQRGLKGIDYSQANWGGPKSDDRCFPVASHVFNHSLQFPQELFLVPDEHDLDYVVEVLNRIQRGEA